jgi:probable phosphoglycerate mutase
VIVLVRHAETDLNAARVVQPANTPLGSRGLEQGRLLAARVAALGAGVVLTSDLHRARMTAEAIVEATGAPLKPSSLLQERDFGDVRGTPYAELTEDIFAPGFAPPGGEKAAEFEARAARAWKWVQSEAAAVNGNVVVVTHGLVCRAIALGCLALAPDTVPMRFGNTSLTVVTKEWPHQVSLLNCIAHLTSCAGDDTAAPGGI